MRLSGKHWSEGVAKVVVWLSGLLDFEQAAEVLEQVGQMAVSDSSVWRQAQYWGERFGELEAGVWRDDTESENVLLRKRPKRMGVAMDGTMIHIREEGWKELKVGCVFDVEVSPARDERTREVVELGHAVRNSYVPYLGGPEAFGEQVWTEARRRGWDRASDTQVVGDGAAWVWNLAATHFYDSQQVVDWYHATEHLAQAARFLHGDGTPEAQQWFRKWETPLFQGQAEQIAANLTAVSSQHPSVAADILREAGYFDHNQRRMNYLEMREEGWLIGSGMVESGGKQFKARFAGPGMRWSRAGAQRLLPVRAAILSGRFDLLWKKAFALPPN